MAIRRLVSVFLTLSMLGASVPAAVAADDGAATQRTATEPGFSASARQAPVRTLEAAAFEAAMQRNRRTRRSNPYATLSYVLMGAGGGLTVYGLTHATGIECDLGGANIGCKQTRSKGLLFGGLGAAAVGLWLFMRGERERNVMPSISFDGRTIVASKRWSF